MNDKSELLPASGTTLEAQVSTPCATDKAFSEVLQFHSIVICPYANLFQVQDGGSLHCGGPIWPQWEKQTTARHCRCGRPVDDRPVINEVPTPLERTLAWGGAVVRHFGHQIADFSMRLLPTLVEWPNAVFAFATLPRYGFGDLEHTPGHFREILGWFGISMDRVVFLTKPTVVDEICVAPQAEQLGKGPSLAHLDLLDEFTGRRLGAPPRQGVLFVSRAGIRGRFAGEGYLEQALRKTGIDVMRPETLPLPEQLRAYLSASDIIFSEGSAVHATQLMGRALGNVHVLVRRSGAKLASHALEPRARTLTYHDLTAGLVHGLDFRRRAMLATGLSILCEDLLLEHFRNRFGIELRRHWKSRDFRAVRDEDVRQWLQLEPKSRFGKAKGSLETILATLAAAGLAHFQPEAERFWRTS